MAGVARSDPGQRLVSAAKVLDTEAHEIFLLWRYRIVPYRTSPVAVWVFIGIPRSQGRRAGR
jgi:hypothetical protein